MLLLFFMFILFNSHLELKISFNIYNGIDEIVILYSNFCILETKWKIIKFYKFKKLLECSFTKK